ncbi:MAG TPA: hypothetical protein VHZ73_09345 [Vicinamibacterales bacterium]|nr:hypothetical protein [Vicinamibacterales bacterium]
MKRLIAIAALGFVTFGVQMRAAGAIVGYISDQECAVKSANASKASEWIKPAMFESCVKDCLKEKDAQAVFVTEDNKILKFDEASRKKMDAHLGHKVSVTGTVQNGMIKVDSVTDLKLQ